MALIIISHILLNTTYRTIYEIIISAMETTVPLARRTLNVAEAGANGLCLGHWWHYHWPVQTLCRSVCLPPRWSAKIITIAPHRQTETDRERSQWNSHRPQCVIVVHIYKICGTRLAAPGADMMKYCNAFGRRGQSNVFVLKVFRSLWLVLSSSDTLA